MVRVRAIKPCFLDKCFREVGVEFDYNGDFGPNMPVVPIDEDGDVTAMPKRGRDVRATKKAVDAQRANAEKKDQE